jgi:hypothetical protein
VSELTAEVEPVAVPVTRVVLPVWSWLLLLVPVAGWLALLFVAAGRRPVRSEVGVAAASVVRVARVRRARDVVVVASPVVLAIGVGGRVVDTGWAGGVLTVAVLSPVLVWIVARVFEASVVSSPVP